MVEFDERRSELGRARRERESARQATAQARERLKLLSRREGALLRSASPNDQRAQAELTRVREERAATETSLKRELERGERARASEREARSRFALLSDPREAIARFRDDLPILLMPVRLETRFKGRELWVRIFPDDCWIDSFDPTLTDSELKDARGYWLGSFKAGGVEAEERSAWRALVTALGSGRASWVRSQTTPTNLAAKPSKARSEDVILVVAVEGTLPDAEKLALGAYFRAIWSADGDAAEIAAARTALDTAVGGPHAASLLERFVPSNLTEPLAVGFARSDLTVSVSFVEFAPADTKESAWSRAPRAEVLPDRFVFVGERAGKVTLVELGGAVPSPLPVGPDPSLPEADQLRHDEDGNLVVPDDIAWLTDFGRALDVGMALRVPLDADQAESGFDRVYVIGLCLGLDEKESVSALETLLRHHSFTQGGLELLPQGVPTNNTELKGAGLSRGSDAEASFDDLRAPLFDREVDWSKKRDGQWLAEYLGVDPQLFEHVHGAGGTDQRATRAMNVALWPATLGHWMESMMSPLFSRDDIEQTRRFFTDYVLGPGAIPAIRIGSQPYGILPSTPLSRPGWLDGEGRLPNLDDSLLPYLRRALPLLRAVDADFRAAAAGVSHVGKAGDPHEILLDIVGLHPGSVEWTKRYAESLKSVFNRLNLLGLSGFFQALLLVAERAQSRELLERLGAPADREPEVLNLLFGARHLALKGGAVDDRPLSETALLRAQSVAGQNYLAWLAEAAGQSLDALYRQKGFVDDTPPTALLYLFLRHALQLGYHDVGVRLHENAGLLNAEAAAMARVDRPFLHIQQQTEISESRYQPLYATSALITGNAERQVHEYIAAELPTLGVASTLRAQREAVERLASEPTARLERAFADHMDTCAYRLDAWWLGFSHFQLAAMRGLRDGSDAPPRRGIHLGAYAFLEEVRPENKQLSPVVLRDEQLIEDFGEGPELVRDSLNQGYVHAPSLNHAVTAAVLRNGFLSNASPENRQTLAVNLTSERVRCALGALEGIRSGQGLPDLLGYQFERGLHDRHALAEVDQFIFKLRKAFPLRADRLKVTKTDEGVPIEAIEARNVIDGLALVEQIKRTGEKTYPFGKPELPETTTAAQADALNAEAERLLETHDAVADLALAEGVHQAVLGNYERVASTYDAYARGNFPPEPEVIRTPRSGVTLTHRVTVHLGGGVSPTASPVPGVPMTPRAQGEPALNRWLASVLPPPSQVALLVSFREAATGASTTREITLADLELQPADLVALIRDDNEQSMSELDDRFLRHAVETFGPRPDSPIQLRYLEKQAAPYSLFELMPLVRSLRRLTTRSRPLAVTDLRLTNEATTAQDAGRSVDLQRVVLVRDAMQILRADVSAFEAALAGPLSDLEHRRDEILTSVDAYVDAVVGLLTRAATFAVPQAGWGFAYDFRRRVYGAMLVQADDLSTRWSEKHTRFQALLDEEASLPIGASAAERFRILQQAEQAISTEPTPLPATSALFRNGLITLTEPAFQARRGAFSGLANSTRTRVSELLADVRALLPVSAFDVVEYSLSDHENEFVTFAEQTLAVVRQVAGELQARLDAANLELAEYAGADDATRVGLFESIAKKLLGADFKVFPEFFLPGPLGTELEQALAMSRSGALFAHLGDEDFPVDTWLYGVARVREKLEAWEKLTLFAGSLGGSEPSLDALQLPFVPGDAWLGLEIPAVQKLDQERLLYTTHFAVAFDKNALTSGLLLDEWTETIPLPDIDTGIAFHYDRPSCEAPQAMLLLTPSTFRGAWQWSDVVDSLRETLELAKLRAIEPSHVDQTPYAPFLPATIVASQSAQLTIAANLALNNAALAIAKEP